MFRRVLRAAGALLLLFHVWLFGSHAWTGALVDTDRLLRWLAAAGLAALLIGLRRRGGSMLVGRRSVVIWLLAALLHGPAVVDRFSATDIPALPAVTLTLTQVGILSIATGLGALALWRLWKSAGLRSVAAEVARFVLVDLPRPGAIAPGVIPLLASRPPPRN